MNSAEAYDYIVKIAKEHALISEAGGGVCVIMHPQTQKESGNFEMIQYIHGLGAHPETLKIITKPC